LLGVLLGSGCEGVNFEQASISLEGTLLLADLLEDVRQRFERAEMIRVESERPAQIAQRPLDLVLRVEDLDPLTPDLGIVGRKIDDGIEELERELRLLLVE